MTESQKHGKYHVVLTPKYRRKVFYGEKRKNIGCIFRQPCEWKRIHSVEVKVCPDHADMLLEIPPKVSLSIFVGFLKGESRVLLYEPILE